METIERLLDGIHNEIADLRAGGKEPVLIIGSFELEKHLCMNMSLSVIKVNGELKHKLSGVPIIFNGFCKTFEVL